MSNPQSYNNLLENISLKDYILKFQENRLYLIIVIIAICIQLLLYKYLYPFANFLEGDSFCYINLARDNAQIDTYPIGYPMFLRIFSSITVSDTALIVFQYILLQGAAYAFVLTMFYFFSPHKVFKIVILFTTIFNPLLFILANTVSSDNFFLSLSLIWITLLIWIIYKPTKSVVYWHAIILFVLLTVRFNALFYPVISLFAFFLSRDAIKLKLKGILFFVVLMGSFLIYNREKYYALCGQRQFSVFSGWLTANNGLYAYRHVPIESRKIVPKKFEKLDLVVRNYIDYINQNPDNVIDNGKAAYDFMWAQESPLWIYCIKATNLVYGQSDLKARSTFGPLYSEYGTWLMLNYPLPLFRYLILPNIKNWFIPPMESLDKYNGGYINVTQNIVSWFRYKSNILTTRIKDPYILEGIVRLYPLWTCIVHVLLLLSLVYYLIFKWRYNPSNLNRVVLFISFFWIFNFCFNVFASPIQMRHVMFPVQISTVFSFLMIGML